MIDFEVLLTEDANGDLEGIDPYVAEQDARERPRSPGPHRFTNGPLLAVRAASFNCLPVLSSFQADRSG